MYREAPTDLAFESIKDHLRIGSTITELSTNTGIRRNEVIDYLKILAGQKKLVKRGGKLFLVE
ncbi:hypothetical protein ACE1AT_12625 [Pelatocladus sp. BLCC-F211]|uniref:hypothetical protein n=1 Tax=Pelatocladus sp. BLCC-F211 TaxID=3342752 RepID=UPI0035B8665B